MNHPRKALIAVDDAQIASIDHNAGWRLFEDGAIIRPTDLVRHPSNARLTVTRSELSERVLFTFSKGGSVALAHAAPMPSDERDTGLSVIGPTPWSAHFSLFYETPADLLDTIVPYFEAGLKGNELCVWLLSEPTLEKEAADRLRSRVPDFDARMARGELEFISAEQGYRPEGHFDGVDILRRWHKRLERVHERGYAGLRASGDLSWVQAADWGAVAQYEETVHAFMRNRPMINLCTYPLTGRKATDILDSVRAHHVVIAKRGGTWQVLETPTLTQTTEHIQRANEELEQRVAERTRQLARSEAYLAEGERVSHTGSYAIDVASKEFRYVSDEGLRIFGFEPGYPLPSRAEFLERHYPDARLRVQAAWDILLNEGRDTEDEFRILLPDGRTRYLYVIRHPVFDAGGRVVEIVGTALDITERKLAAAKLTRTRRAARERALKARFAAALEERTRLAREIHDSLLQGVTGIALQLRATLPRLRGAATSVVDSVRGVVELAEATIRDARRAVWDMRAPLLVQKGLPSALEDAVRRAAGDVRLEFAIDGKPRPLPSVAEDTVFRVGREAVLNAVKHATPRKIEVTLTYKPRSARLTVSDDGRGFDVEHAFRAYAGHWGLLGMRERADRIGASLAIRSVLHRGTTVDLRVPMSRSGKHR